MYLLQITNNCNLKFWPHLSVMWKSMCIFKYGLSCSRHVRVKRKEKAADVSESNQNIRSSYKSKFRLTEL